MTNATSNDKQENILKRSANAVIDLLSSFFLPIINLLVSVGILKGALTLLQVSGVVAADTTTYAILNGMADALFYFIPIFLAFTASKRFGVDTVTGMLIGCIILYPSITEIMAGGEPVYLFGLELQKATYSSSVIPILLAIYTASWVQKACYNVIPETFRGMFTPPITIVIVIPLTLGVFGPLGTLVGGWLATGYEFVYGLSPLVAGILIGAFQPFLVILGLHWALFTIAMNNVAVYGFDTIMALFGGAGGCLENQEQEVPLSGDLGVSHDSPRHHRACYVRRELATEEAHGLRLRCRRTGKRCRRILRLRGNRIRAARPHDAAGIHEQGVHSLLHLSCRRFRACVHLHADGAVQRPHRGGDGCGGGGVTGLLIRMGNAVT